MFSLSSCCWCDLRLCLEIGLNSLTPKSDRHLISPNNITPASNIQVTRIEEMITN